MFVLDETSALLYQIEIDLCRKVVLEEDHDDQDEPGHECEAGEIVQILRNLGDIRERIRADQWQQQNLPEGDVEAGQAENDEGCRRQPMRKTLKGLEADDLLA